MRGSDYTRNNLFFINIEVDPIIIYPKQKELNNNG